MNLTVLADNMTKKSTEDLIKKFANLGVDTLSPNVFENFDEYPITQVASADTTLNISAIYALLDPDYEVIHLGKTTELRNNTRTHLYSISKSRLKGKKPLLKFKCINTYKIRFLRESDFSLENVEKFILVCFKPGKQS